MMPDDDVGVRELTHLGGCACDVVHLPVYPWTWTWMRTWT